MDVVVGADTEADVVSVDADTQTEAIVVRMNTAVGTDKETSCVCVDAVVGTENEAGVAGWIQLIAQKLRRAVFVRMQL